MNPERISAFLRAERAVLPGHKLIEKSRLKDGTWAFYVTGKDCPGGGRHAAEIGTGNENAGLFAFQVVSQCPIGRCAVEFVWLINEKRWATGNELEELIRNDKIAECG